MRLLLALAIAFCASRALAQADAGTPQVTPAEEGEIRFREPGADFRWHAPPAVGSCIGGTCGAVPRTTLPAPMLAPPTNDRAPHEARLRFAYTGAILGAVSAGVVLGSAIAIATVDDYGSERITRGVWVGYLAVSTSLVALSAHLARGPGAATESSKAARNLGWTAFALAMTDGLILWAGAFRGFTHVDALTIGAGAIGAAALLPHALDALVESRSMKVRRIGGLEPVANGLRVRF
ncbi:MAG TPA: hypothetical protein VI299_02380 [Polyangiales bacterium]